MSKDFVACDTHTNSTEHEPSTAKQNWIICYYEQLLLRGTEIEEERNKNRKRANERISSLSLITQSAAWDDSLYVFFCLMLAVSPENERDKWIALSF